MSKYIPKVGEEFEWLSISGGWSKQTCAIVTKKIVAYENEGGYLDCIPKEYEFRSVPTKADVERERLLKILDECYESGLSITAKEIQKSGFTIPKKVKRSDIEKCVNHWVSFEYGVLSNSICELLGDLLESDND